jgi:outer membrane receptor protein involved in Fe transport
MRAGGTPADSLRAPAVEIPEVVVVGFKQQSEGLEPLSVTRADGYLLGQQQIERVSDLGQLLPNFFMPDYGSRQTSPIYIRGIGSRVNAPAVALYVDGVPHFERSALNIDLSDVRSVELLRGAQGTLYGRNSTAGVINLYTFSPMEFPVRRVRLSYGNYGQAQASATYRRPLGAKMGIAASALYQRSDGFFRNSYSGSMADALQNASGRLALEWCPSRAFRARLSATLDHLEQGGYPYGAYDPATGSLQPVNYDDAGRYRRTIATVGLGLEHTTPRLALRAQSAWQYIGDRQALDQDFTPQPTSYVVQHLRQQLLSQEITLKSVGTSSYRHLTGLFAFAQQLDRDLFSRSSDTRKRYDLPTLGVALYHQSEFRLTGGLSLQLGLRYDYERARERVAGSRLSFSKLTPKGTLSYASSNKQWLLYGSVARGYKSGGFNTAFQAEDERTFQPENNWNFELGAKFASPEGRLSASAALFFINWRNQQVTQMIPGVGNLQHNAARSTSKGGELSVQVRLTTRWRLGIDYGYTDARFRHYVQSPTANYGGRRLPLVPRHTLGITSEAVWMRPFGLVDRLTLSGTLSGIGSICFQESNEVQQPFYALLHARMAASRGRFTCSLWAKNLTHTRYLTYYFYLGGSGYAQAGKPFTLGASLALTW